MTSDENECREGSLRKPGSTKNRTPDEENSRSRKRVSDKEAMDKLVFEQRMLFGATAAVAVAMVIWTVAVSTKYWFHLTAPTEAGLYVNSTNSYFVRSHSGIWTICKFFIVNSTSDGPLSSKCHNHRLNPSSEQLQKNPEVDRTILDYTRTEISFAIISYILMIMGLGFSLYTFKQTRYTFKRLAGGVHFLSAAAVLVVIEVVVNSVIYEEKYLNARHPKGAVWSYGFSFILAWLAFSILIICGIIFIFCSRKRKGDRALGLNSGADEPQIIGRM